MTNMVVVCIDLVERGMHDRLYRIETVQDLLTRLKVLARTLKVL